jgi:hypothetical protein
MEDKPLEGMITPTYYEFEFDCKANPMQPKKFTGKHLFNLDGEEIRDTERPWLLIASLSAITLVVGILIGRFLLP